MRSSLSLPGLLLGVLSLLVLAPAIQGCGDDEPVTPNPTVSTIDSTLHAPLNFKARDAQNDSTSVDLSWQHNSLDTGVVSYLIRWRPDTSSTPAKDSALSQGTNLTVRSLATGVRYRFEIQSMRNGLRATGSVTDTATPRTTVLVIGTPPTPPEKLKAISRSSTSVGLSWTPSTDTGAITYTVRYISSGPVIDSGSVDNISGASMTVTGLDVQAAYTFEVYAVRAGAVSTPISITWAPASRYTGGTIRMYEKTSSNGSGLILDPAKGGPANISIATPSTNVQLAIFVTPNDQVMIGSAYGIDEYKSVDGFDRNVYLSDSAYAVPSLDAWYDDLPIDQRIDEVNGNVSYFTFPGTMSTSGNILFYVRTGSTPTEYHYARVLMKNRGGKILQGTPPNRYIELEISYQNTPNLPYAKRPAGAATPRGWLPAMHH